MGIDEIMVGAVGAGVLAIPATVFAAAGVGCAAAIVAGIVFGGLGFYLAASWE